MRQALHNELCGRQSELHVAARQELGQHGEQSRLVPVFEAHQNLDRGGVGGGGFADTRHGSMMNACAALDQRLRLAGRGGIVQQFDNAVKQRGQGSVVVLRQEGRQGGESGKHHHLIIHARREHARKQRHAYLDDFKLRRSVARLRVSAEDGQRPQAGVNELGRRGKLVRFALRRERAEKRARLQGAIAAKVQETIANVGIVSGNERNHMGGLVGGAKNTTSDIHKIRVVSG